MASTEINASGTGRATTGAERAGIGGLKVESSTVAGAHAVSALAGSRLGGPDNDFVIAEWTDSGRSEWQWIAPPHVHHADDEAWYVLEGVLRFRIGDDTYEMGPGSAVLAPKGTPHAFGNARPGEPARYLVVMTPRIEALIHALHEPGDDDPAAIFRAHKSDLVG